MNMYKKVLATIDLGDPETAERVVNAAKELLTKGDTLHVVCVVPDYGVGVVGTFFPKDHEEIALKNASEALHAFTGKHVEKDTRVQHIIGHGNIYEEIIDAANKVGADIIVIGSDRPKLKDYLLGPNAARVVRHAKQSVLVARAPE